MSFRFTTCNPKLKTVVEVIRSSEAEPWLVHCTRHHTILDVANFAGAVEQSHVPEEWCPDCQALVNTRREQLMHAEEPAPPSELELERMRQRLIDGLE